MKLIKTSALVILSSAFLIACGSNPSISSSVTAESPDFIEHCEYKPGERAPEWYCNPDIEGGIAAVGTAQPNLAGDSNFQRAEALANARDDLARQIETKVANMFKNFSATTGAGEDATFDKATENVSRQVAQQTLSGSKQLKRWLAKDGTLVLLVGMNNNDSVIDGIKSSVQSEKALWQKFQSQKAQEELDKYVEKEFGN